VSAVRLRRADLEGVRLEEEARRAAREAEREQRRAAAEEARLRRQAGREHRELVRLQAEAKRRHCRLCRKPLRKDAAPSTHWCHLCLSAVKDTCPHCGAPKRLDSERCRRCHGGQASFGREPVVRTNLGVCRHEWYRYRQRWIPRPGCQVQWGNLDHHHCGCGRPMSADPDVELCGRCTAQELARPHDGQCGICGDRSADEVCPVCRLDLERQMATSLGRLRALFHTPRVEVGGGITIESDLAI